MKIERVGSDKVRVRISHEELTEMNVNPDMFFSDSNALNTLIIKILREIHETTDFGPFFGSVQMEATPDGDGMSIILSRVPDFSGAEGIKKDDIARLLDRLGVGRNDDEAEKSIALTGRIRRLPTEAKRVVRLKKHRKIKGVRAVKDSSRETLQTFEFESFEDMCLALCRMSGNVTEMSELYRLDGSYMLLVPVVTSALDDIAMLMEFASDIKRGMVYEYVHEHGECVAKGAELTAMSKKVAELV